MTTPVQTKAEPVLADAADRRFTLPWVKAMALRYSMFLVMLVVIAYFSYRSARFSTVDNLQTILIAAAPFALIALGQTLVILTGGIDLSVGSVIAVAGMTGATAGQGLSRSAVHPHRRRHPRRPARRVDQRGADRLAERATVHRHARHADRGLAASPS